jgi:hypothetical protein
MAEVSRRKKSRNLNDQSSLRFWVELLLAVGIVAGVSYLAVSLF